MAKTVLTNDFLNALRETLPEVQLNNIREALNERDNLRSLVGEKDEAISKFRNENIRLEIDNSQFQEENTDLRVKLDFALKEDADLRREKNNNDVAVAKAELGGFKDAVNTLMRNTITRETLQHQVINEGDTVQTHYLPNGQAQAVPVHYKTNMPVTDIKSTETE